MCGAQITDGATTCAACGSRGAVVPAVAASGLADNVAGMLAYFTIIPAIVFLVLEPYNRSRFVRFHAWQSIFFNVAWWDWPAHCRAYAFSRISNPAHLATGRFGRFHCLDHPGDKSEPGTNVQTARDRGPGAATGWLSIAAHKQQREAPPSGVWFLAVSALGFRCASADSAALDFLSPSCHSY